MNRKISLAQHTVPSWHPVEMIYNAARLGFDCVSIRAIAQGVPGELFFDIVPPAKQNEIRQAMDDTGVFIHDIDLIAIGDETRIESYEPSLAAAARLGIQGVVSSVWTDDKPLYTDKFAQLCDLAERYGLTVNLEFVTWASVKGIKDSFQLLDTVKKENARILVDTLHWHRSGVSFEDLAQCPREWVDLVHICDIAPETPDTLEELARTGRQERLYPGEGAAPILQVVQAVQDNAVIAIEIPNKQRLEKYGAYEYARRCLEETKRYLHIQ